MLKENLEKVEENIQAACDRAGSKRDEVTLIAVSKTKPPHMLQEPWSPYKRRKQSTGTGF